MRCKEVAEVIEQEGFSPLPDAARGHVAGCAACSALIADFERIVELAHEIPAEVEPPSRVWISLRARLEAEKIISEPDYVVQTQSAPWIFHATPSLYSYTTLCLPPDMCATNPA